MVTEHEPQICPESLSVLHCITVACASGAADHCDVRSRWGPPRRAVPPPAAVACWRFVALLPHLSDLFFSLRGQLVGFA